MPKAIAWLMLTFVFLSSLYNTLVPKPKEEIELPPHYTDRVMHVGLTFAKEWLTINSGEREEDYQRRISPFLRPDLVNTNAGLRYPRKDEDFRQKVEIAWIESVRQLDDSHFLANVGVLLDANGTKKRMVVNVPVARDPSTGQFVVYENPGFSPVTSVADVPGMDFGEEVTVADVRLLHTMLTNFFAKYIESDDQAELINFLIDEAKGYVIPKGGVMRFKSVDSVTTYFAGQTSDGSFDIYMGKVRVTVYDPATDLEIASDYIVAIYERDNKYFIGNIAP